MGCHSRLRLIRLVRQRYSSQRRCSCRVGINLKKKRKIRSPSWVLHFKSTAQSRHLTLGSFSASALILLLHCALSCAVYCNRPCLFVCLFVGPPYYSQRAVFASPLSAFHFIWVAESVQRFSYRRWPGRYVSFSKVVRHTATFQCYSDRSFV